MNQNMAGAIVIVGAAIGVAIWALGIRCYYKMKSMPTRLSKSSSISGVSKEQALKALLKHSATQYRIVERSDDGFTLQLLLSSLILRFQSQAEGVFFETDVDLSKLSRVLGGIMAALVLGLEPLFVIGIPCLLWGLVVQSDVPAVRWQVFQVIQIIHVLWPPFLVCLLYKVFRNRVETVSDHLHALIAVTE